MKHGAVHKFRFNAASRIVIAICVAAIAFLMQPVSSVLNTKLLISWDTGALIYLSLAWLIVYRSDAGMTRERTLNQDQSSHAIFLIILTAASVSIVAIGFMLTSLKELTFWLKTWHLMIAIGALIASWLLIQTVFAFHYARRYYEARRKDPQDSGPLIFPGDRQPDYLDFIYYSFVIGMTSQVSDVAVNSRQMRRLTLVHGVLSFIFNIAVVALSINIIASVI